MVCGLMSKLEVDVRVLFGDGLVVVLREGMALVGADGFAAGGGGSGRKN